MTDLHLSSSTVIAIGMCPASGMQHASGLSVLSEVLSGGSREPSLDGSGF